MSGKLTRYGYIQLWRLWSRLALLLQPYYLLHRSCFIIRKPTGYICARILLWYIAHLMLLDQIRRTFIATALMRGRLLYRLNLKTVGFWVSAGKNFNGKQKLYNWGDRRDGERVAFVSNTKIRRSLQRPAREAPRAEIPEGKNSESDEAVPRSSVAAERGTLQTAETWQMASNISRVRMQSNIESSGRSSKGRHNRVHRWEHRKYRMDLRQPIAEQTRRTRKEHMKETSLR